MGSLMTFNPFGHVLSWKEVFFSNASATCAFMVLVELFTVCFNHTFTITITNKTSLKEKRVTSIDMSCSAIFLATIANTHFITNLASYETREVVKQLLSLLFKM